MFTSNLGLLKKKRKIIIINLRLLENGYDYGNFSRVEISPNPVGPEDNYLDITVSGYASTSSFFFFL